MSRVGIGPAPEVARPGPAGAFPGERAARREGLALLVTVVLAWGLMWPVNKVILASLSPLWTMALRSAIAAVAVFGLAACRGRFALPPRGDLPVVVSIALLHMVGFGVAASWGLQLVPTGRSVVLAYTTPLWVTPPAPPITRLTVLVLVPALPTRPVVRLSEVPLSVYPGSRWVSRICTKL